MQVKFKRYTALIAVLLLTGCPPLSKTYQLVVSDDQVNSIMPRESSDSYWMCYDDSCDLKFSFDPGLRKSGRKYWLEVVFEYESYLNQSISLIPDPISLESTLFNYKFYDVESYEHISVKKKSWEEFIGAVPSNMKVLRFRAFPKDRKKVYGDTLRLSGAQIYIGDSISFELPELKFVMNETKSSFLGKRQR